MRAGKLGGRGDPRAFDGSQLATRPLFRAAGRALPRAARRRGGFEAHFPRRSSCTRSARARSRSPGRGSATASGSAARGGASRRASSSEPRSRRSSGSAPRPWAERARAELRASGETLRRASPGGRGADAAGASDRLQVAEGKTNKEVGAALFLSHKTVEFHLSRIYRKLDIHSRAELISARRPSGAGRGVRATKPDRRGHGVRPLRRVTGRPERRPTRTDAAGSASSATSRSPAVWRRSTTSRSASRRSRRSSACTRRPVGHDRRRAGVGVGAAGRARRTVPAPRGLCRAGVGVPDRQRRRTSGAGGWSGPTYGWLNGWVGLCAYAVANTTIAYLGAPWALAVLGIEPTATALVVTGVVLVACSLVNATASACSS